MSLMIKAKKNTFAYYANFFTNVLLTFLFTPILVKYLGTTYFGVWKTTQKLLDFASAADGRSAQALKWIIANQEASDDDDRKRRAVGSALRISIYFLPILSLLLAVLVFLAPSAIRGLAGSDINMVRLFTLTLGANVVLGPLLGIPDAVLVGTNKGYQSIGIQTVWLIISNVTMLALAVNGFGLIYLAGTVLSCAVLNALCVLWVAKRTVKWLGVQKPGPQENTTFFAFSGWILLWALIEKLLLSSEVLIIGFTIGPIEVTRYSFTAYVAQFAVAICLLTGSAVTPGLGALISSQDVTTASQAIRKLREVVLAIAAVIAGVTLIMNKSFVNIWVGERFYLGDIANILLVALFLQVVIIRSEAQVHDLGLKIRTRAVLGFLSVTFGLFLGVLLGWKYNSAVAVMAGLFVGRLLLLCALPAMVDKAILVRQRLWPIYIWCVIILLPCAIVGIILPLLSIHLAISFALFSAAALFAACYALLLSDDTKMTVKAMVFSRFNRD